MRLNAYFLSGLILSLPSSTIAIQNHPRTAASTLSGPPASASSASPAPSFSSTLIALTSTPTEMKEPRITEPPEILDGDIDGMLQEKYHMTTYYSCVTIGTQVHCGYHEPILAGGDEIAAAAPEILRGKGRAGFAALFAGAVAVILR